MISIIIPTYNRAKLLEGTLDSILRQTYLDWECIVVDDGSTDSTPEMMHSFCDRDHRIRYFQRAKNRLKGAPTCRNIGLENAKGEYLLFFDSDDILRPKTLDSRMQLVQENKGLDFWVFQTVRFLGELETADRIWNDLSKPNSCDMTDFLQINPVWHTSGPVWSRAFLKKNSLTFTEGVLSWQDWEFHIRALLDSPKYAKFENLEAAVYQRFHEGEAINKAETVAVKRDRIELFFKLINTFKTAQRFERPVQVSFLKLFYFVLSRGTEIGETAAVWKKMSHELHLVSRVDLVFWKNYLLYISGKKSKEVWVFLFLKKLKPFFYKRMPVDDFKNRTWYRIQIK